MEFDRRTVLSDSDSGLGSTLSDPSIIPMADHTLDGPQSHLTLALAPSFSSLCTTRSDHGYDSLCTADFSSIGSSVSGYDSGLVLSRETPPGASPHAAVHRHSSDGPSRTPSTSQPSRTLSHASRTGSWHEETSRQKLRNFAHKMNYSDREFEASIAELGVEGTDCDKLLKNLVKLRDARPASQLVTTPTVPKAKKVSSSKSRNRSEGDSKGLRRIVIDGSNVAME